MAVKLELVLISLIWNYSLSLYIRHFKLNSHILFKFDLGYPLSLFLLRPIADTDFFYLNMKIGQVFSHVTVLHQGVFGHCWSEVLCAKVYKIVYIVHVNLQSDRRL